MKPHIIELINDVYVVRCLGCWRVFQTTKNKIEHGGGKFHEKSCFDKFKVKQSLFRLNNKRKILEEDINKLLRYVKRQKDERERSKVYEDIDKLIINVLLLDNKIAYSIEKYGASRFD